MFYRSQVLFWLLAAIDGHAKNFSVFIEPGGKYRLTPLYDIISAYPLVTKQQLQAKKIKMAMVLEGKTAHYHWHNIQRRHFLDIPNYSAERAEAILDEMLQQVDQVIGQVAKKLPAEFPREVADPIFNGICQKARKLTM